MVQLDVDGRMTMFAPGYLAPSRRLETDSMGSWTGSIEWWLFHDDGQECRPRTAIDHVGKLVLFHHTAALRLKALVEIEVCLVPICRLRLPVANTLVQNKFCLPA
jgi:hypothetical protein